MRQPNPSDAYNRHHGAPQFSGLTNSNRSYSIESSTTWDSRQLDYTARSVSPNKKQTGWPDPPPNFILHKDKTVEYDKNGRLHYIPKATNIARSASYDLYGTMATSTYSAANTTPGGSTVTTTTANTTNSLLRTKNDSKNVVYGLNHFDRDEDDNSLAHSRMNSTGTNILYKIRREELAKGQNPSVRSLARAFESAHNLNGNGGNAQPPDTKVKKKGLFSMRKSRSVDTDAQKDGTKQIPNKQIVPSPNMERSITASVNKNDDICGTSTLPRGGRNPFKNMGAKIVERVRRSLSRSSRGRGESQEKTPVPMPFVVENQLEKMNPFMDSEKRNTIIEKPPSKVNPNKSAQKIKK